MFIWHVGEWKWREEKKVIQDKTKCEIKEAIQISASAWLFSFNSFIQMAIMCCGEGARKKTLLRYISLLLNCIIAPSNSYIHIRVHTCVRTLNEMCALAIENPTHTYTCEILILWVTVARLECPADRKWKIF